MVFARENVLRFRCRSHLSEKKNANNFVISRMRSFHDFADYLRGEIKLSGKNMQITEHLKEWQWQGAIRDPRVGFATDFFRVIIVYLKFKSVNNVRSDYFPSYQAEPSGILSWKPLP